MLEINTSIYNDRYVPYLKVLLMSIKKQYGDTVKVNVLYNSVSEEHIKEVQKKFPDVALKSIACAYPLQDKKSKLPSRKLNLWYEQMIQTDSKKIVFMDCDMLICHKLDKFFEGDFDIAYTYKTEEHENLRTPLNIGIVLINNSEKMKEFMKEWRDRTNRTLADQGLDNIAGRDWGAADQAVFGAFLNSRVVEDYENIITYKDYRFQGFMCKELNEAACTPVEEYLHVIHYKTRWREVLPGGTFTEYRPKEKCLPQYEIWKAHYDEYNAL